MSCWSSRKNNISVILLCDTNHVLQSDYSEVRVIGAGADAVDFALVSLCQKGNIVVTQDYGVAARDLIYQCLRLRQLCKTVIEWIYLQKKGDPYARNQ